MGSFNKNIFSSIGKFCIVEVAPFDLPLNERVFFILQPFLQKYGKRVLIPGIVCGSAIFYFFLQPNDEPSPTYQLIEPIQEQQTEEPLVTLSEIQEDATVFVDVKGAVHYPGVYELTDQHRIVDAVELAGGYLTDANPQFINHAQKLQDEMVIYIPKHGEQLTEEEQQLVTIASASGNSSSGSSSTSGKVNLNKADEAALTTLPGVGPAKAQAIIAYREESGGFQTIDDIKKVSGIGEKSFERLKDLIDIK